MTAKVTVDWTCDNCGKTARSSGDRPDGWRGDLPSALRPSIFASTDTGGLDLLRQPIFCDECRSAVKVAGEEALVSRSGLYRRTA